ncbi:MAG: haloacid dehalogenase-like hydrolase [Verrucomicrobia bacterium]|nr:haloacid dehalogenase-like hydrolase [Verrucomicrobiota bacterium]
MKLFLFDIDGTLLTTDGAGRAALKSAGTDLFAIQEDLRTINVSGSTDTAIVQEILRHHSLEVSVANVNRYLGGYLVWLQQHLTTLSGAILPGVMPLLDLLVEEGHGIGLLTGNVRRGAEIKLSAHGIWDRFSFGAFGDDNADRNKLGPIAKGRAEARLNTKFQESDIFVIGDTPKDIACAHAFGGIAVAVATGRYSFDNLREYQPDHLCRDLEDTKDLLFRFGLR